MNRISKRLLYCLITAAGFFVVPLIGMGQEQPMDVPANDKCLACHTDNDMLPDGFMKEDVHLLRGLTCAGCHGGNSSLDDGDEAMSPKAGFLGVPARKDIPHFCGRCHSNIDYMRKYQPRIATDQEQQYKTSVHGQRLQKGDEKVAECASCHTAHAILPAIDARSSVNALRVPGMCNRCHGDSDYMRGYGIPTDQYEKYAKSVHGTALLERKDTGSPACNDCHGNHGAVPPGVASIEQVCGSCHFNNMQYFSASKMGEAFRKEHLHGCEECHNHHDIEKTDDEMIGVGDKSVCIECHAAGDKGYEVAEEMGAMIEKLAADYNSALEKQTKVQRLGMDDVDISFLLQESHQSLVHSRTLVHTFDPDRLAPTINEGISRADSATALAIAQVKEHNTRRRGFGMATVFITILIVALFLKLRQMEAK